MNKSIHNYAVAEVALNRAIAALAVGSEHFY